MKLWMRTLCLLVLFSITLSSCGVMFGGSRFSGSIIVKDHPNAEIYVRGNNIGKGTAVGVFPRRQPLAVEVRQEGCEPKTVQFRKAFRGGNFALSVIMWGGSGLILDLATGSCFKPEHKLDPAVERLTYDNFIFTVDYAGCDNGTK